MDPLWELWDRTLELTDNIVPVRDTKGNVKLAFVDGDYFGLVSEKTEFADDQPDRDNYNVAPPWMASLFKTDTKALYDQCVTGLIRDPTEHCCRELSWSRCSELERTEVLKLMYNAAKESLCSDRISKRSQAEAQVFLDGFARMDKTKNEEAI